MRFIFHSMDISEAHPSCGPTCRACSAQKLKEDPKRLRRYRRCLPAPQRDRSHGASSAQPDARWHCHRDGTHRGGAAPAAGEGGGCWRPCSSVKGQTVGRNPTLMHLPSQPKFQEGRAKREKRKPKQKRFPGRAWGAGLGQLTASALRAHLRKSLPSHLPQQSWGQLGASSPVSILTLPTSTVVTKADISDTSATGVEKKTTVFTGKRF